MGKVTFEKLEINMTKEIKSGTNSEESKFFDNLITSVAQAHKTTFSLEEAAEYLHISVESVLYYSKRTRELSYVPLGKGEIVFRKVDLDEFLEKKLKRGFIPEG
ncbi:MAG: helix-turn-helix domain-containing protein [bacterium]